MFGLVVAEKNFVSLEIYGLAANVVAVDLVDGSLYPEIPEVHGLVPSSAQQDVVVGWIPLKAKNSVVVFAEMTSLHLSRLPLVQLPESNPADLPRKSIVRSLRTYLARLQHLVVLSKTTATFFENSS